MEIGKGMTLSQTLIMQVGEIIPISPGQKVKTKEAPLVIPYKVSLKDFPLKPRNNSHPNLNRPLLRNL